MKIVIEKQRIHVIYYYNYVTKYQIVNFMNNKAYKKLCYKIKVIEIYIEFIFQCAKCAFYSNFNLCIIISISI